MTTNPVQAAYDRLTDDQRNLEHHVTTTAKGRDLRDILIEVDAPLEDKAAVAEFLGGPGAGVEFLDGTTR